MSSGEETYLLTKKELFLEFEKYKGRVGKKFPSGLVSFSPHVFRGIGSVSKEYGHNTESMKNIIDKAENINDLMNLFMHPRMDMKKASIWCEKTPGNSLLFRECLSQLDQCKIIHIVRNPYDTILSMLKRGMNPIYAFLIYYYNNAGGLNADDDKRYHRIKYEDILTDSESTVQDLCNFLQLDYQKEMLSGLPINNLSETNLPTWNADETAQVDRSNMNTFSYADGSDKAIIHHLLNYVRPTEEGCKLFNTPHKSVSELCGMMGYTIELVSKERSLMVALKNALQKDKFFRTRKLHFTSSYKLLKLDE